ncbi:MAG: hypothetical protein Q4F97_10045 [Bacteroidales bacterium]|nr:hypothetical protein [Bacteroidales bacterium]
MKDFNEIDILLPKFYDGNTSLEEESLLLELLKDDDLPDKYYTDKMIVESLNCEDATEIPINLKDNISRNIDEFDEEIYRIDFNKNDSQPIKYKKSKSVKMIFAISSIAAIFIFIISLSFYIRNLNNTPKDTFSDPQMAYVETERILKIVGENLNKGNLAIKEANNQITKTKSTIENVFK